MTPFLVRRSIMKHAKQITAAILTVIFIFCLTPAVMADTGYTDVPAGSWCAEAVTYCAENGLMCGTDKGVFSPEAPIDRAMFVTVLHRLAGKPAADEKSLFKDVPDDAYCADAVAWAAGLGVVLGYEDMSFRPHQAINREQMACMLARYMLLIDAPLIYGPEAELAYSDSSLISDYARDSVDLIRKTGLMRGFSNSDFRPQSTASRAEAAVLFSRFSSALEAELPATLTVYAGDGQDSGHRYLLTKADADKLCEYLSSMEKTEGLHAEFIPTHVLSINGVEYSFELDAAGQMPEGCNYSAGEGGEYGILTDGFGKVMTDVISIINSYIK